MNTKSSKPDILLALPGSCPEIQAKIGVAGSSVRKHIKDLRDSKKIYIMGWSRKTVGKFVAIYAVGNKADKKCPFNKVTAKQKGKRAWRRIKAERSFEHKYALERARVAADRAAKGSQNTWLSPLYALNGMESHA